MNRRPSIHAMLDPELAVQGRQAPLGGQITANLTSDNGTCRGLQRFTVPHPRGDLESLGAVVVRRK